MQSLPDDYPITGLCVVSDPTKCPPGYEVMYRSYDKSDDCDLWKDSIFRSKVTRYLCFTRVFPLNNGLLNNVLADVCINMDREPPPLGFSIIDFTIDSREKATRKKQICVKMLPRDSTTNAISEVIILSRSKRPPTGFTLIGEMNGLILCFKMNPVPTETQNSTSEQNSTCTTEESNAEPYPLHPVENNLQNHSTPASSLQRADSLSAQTIALFGVPFQLNSRLTDVQKLKNMYVPEVSYRSLNDIESEYNYSFRTERSCSHLISDSCIDLE